MSTENTIKERGKYAKLDSKDKAILNELSRDSAQSAAEISRKTGISKQVIGYRIKDLIKEGVIKQNYAIIDLGILGYELYDVLIRYKTLANEREVINYLKRKKNVISCDKCINRFDLIIRAWARNQRELNKLIEDLNIRFKDLVKEKEILYIETANFYGNKEQLGASIISLEPQKETEEQEDEGKEKGREKRKKETKTEKEKPDDKDLLILYELSKDSRTPLLNIAKKTKLSSNAVSYRLNSLRRNKIIIGSSILTEQKVTGERWKVLIRKKMDKERERAFLAHITRHKDITKSEIYSGRWDTGFEIETRQETLRETIMELRNIFSDIIEEIEIVRITEESRRTYAPLKKTDQTE